MSRTNTVKRETNILRWQGDVPVIEAYWYSDRSWFFFCRDCKKFHYHRAVAGHCPARCTSSNSRFIPTGYVLEVKQ